MGTKKIKMPTLDLHGKKQDEVYDLVDRFIMKHHHIERVKIMPGKGTGVVRNQVISYLKQGGYPWSYEDLPNGDKNTGSIIVFLN
ncbi:MAG: Smr/MutS family protein [Bdellovibrionales bacterium]|nr:Smr/MutS family protein [Bdellovibrionales bacterium]